MDPKDGSRHRLWLAQGGAVFGWVTCKTTSGTNNLIPAGTWKEERTEDEEDPATGEVDYSVGNLMQVVTPQPLVMRAGCPLSTGRVRSPLRSPPRTTIDPRALMELPCADPPSPVCARP